MDFFDKIGEVAKNFTEKAGDSLEINRLNGEVSIEKGNIQAYQRELGEYYWAKFAVGETLDEEAMLICDKVVVSQDHIRQLEMEIEKIKKDREIALEERAKAKQLAAQEAEQEEELTQEDDDMEQQEIQEQQELVSPDAEEETAKEDPRFCSNCGGGIKPGQRFCIFCGAQVK